MQIPVLQTSGEILTVEVGPGATIGEFKEEPERLRWEHDSFMRRITNVKILVDSQEVLADHLMVRDAVAPDATVQAIFSERSVKCSNPETAERSLEDPSSLCVLYIPEVTVIEGRAFRGCSSIAKVVIPEGVKTIGGGAFEKCTSLSSVAIPESVTMIAGSAFSECTSLTEVTIPASVTVIGDGAFSACTSLTSAAIPASVTKIESCTFQNCSSLTMVTIPGSVSVIRERAFQRCTSLRTVTIPDSVTEIQWAAFDETSLTSVTIPESVRNVGSFAFGSRVTRLTTCGKNWRPPPESLR